MKNSTINKILASVAVIAIIAAGYTMLNKGTQFSGVAEAADKAAISGNVQEITSNLTAGGGYPDLVVQKGIPVRWNLKVGENDLNSCNNAIVIPEFGIERNLQPGDNIIEFTPEQSGNIPYSCWMGMINAKISIVDDLSAVQTAETISSSDDAALSGTGTAPGIAGGAWGCCRTN